MSGQGELWRTEAPPARTFAMGNQHVPMSSGRNSRPNGARELTIEARNPARAGRIRRAGLGPRESDSGLFSWQKLTLSEELWTSGALSVDGLAVALRGFR